MRCTHPLILVLALSPSLAQAAEPAPSPLASLMQMLLGLGVVLVALYGALVLLRRLQGGRQAQPGALRVLSATSVGPRERVVMVAAGKRVLVLGVAPGRVNMLHALDEADLPPPTEPIPTARGADFAARLKQLLERRP